VDQCSGVGSARLAHEALMKKRSCQLAADSPEFLFCDYESFILSTDSVFLFSIFLPFFKRFGAFFFAMECLLSCLELDLH
jgi:hypothetical protein